MRANVLCLGGVARDQDPTFMARVSERIPLGRMACGDEYGEAIVFLCSDASSYMTGASPRARRWPYCLVAPSGDLYQEARRIFKVPEERFRRL